MPSNPTPQEWEQFRDYCRRLDRMLKEHEGRRNNIWLWVALIWVLAVTASAGLLGVGIAIGKFLL